MSDIEDDKSDNSNHRPLSNVLQPSRTELPKSSAHLLSAVSHEDMKNLPDINFNLSKLELSLGYFSEYESKKSFRSHRVVSISNAS